MPSTRIQITTRDTVQPRIFVSALGLISVLRQKQACFGTRLPYDLTMGKRGLNLPPTARLQSHDLYMQRSPD